MPGRPSSGPPRALAAALAVLAAALPAAAQGPAMDGARLSKQMRLAIELYRRGDDLGAMDRFMEVMLRGDPGERTMANDYLNRITQRMAGASRLDPGPPVGGTTAAEPVASVAVEAAPGLSRRAPVEALPPEPPPAIRAEGPGAPPEPPAEPPVETPSDREAPPERTQGEGPAGDRRVMKEEIDAKIKNRTRELLGALRKWEDVTVRMANARLPRAIGFKPSLLFEDGVRFRKDAGKLVDVLAELVFTLGATQVVLLPEGALFDDAKIMDMRRTMAISSLMMKAGIAPARLRVNLLSSQVDVPRDLQSWRGVLILFQYNQPLNLAGEGEASGGVGPPVSLGVSPAEVDPRAGEGAIVEFSVMEPPAGLMSWRFQLLGPGAKPEDDMVVLQEVKGAAPVFHQIYWNARKRYFGEALPAGRYECVLTATDLRNRAQRARAWVQVKGEPPPAPAAAAKAPPAELEPDDELAAPRPAARARARPSAQAPRARKGKAPRVKRRLPAAARTAPAPAAAAPPEAPAEEPQPPPRKSGVEISAKPSAEPPAEEPGPRAGAVNYQVLFQRGTTNITKEGEGILARVADTMHYYPLDNINLVGYAFNGEPDGAKLAARRAEHVSKLLVERHGMKPDRIKTDTKVVDFEAFKVEIYIVEGAQ